MLNISKELDIARILKESKSDCKVHTFYLYRIPHSWVCILVLYQTQLLPLALLYQFQMYS